MEITQIDNSLFSSLKVIDLSTVLAGPSVATFFAELGAQVLKIEHPNNPDVTRSWKLPSENESSPVSAYFSAVNYKKRYCSLDLRSEKDYAAFQALLEDADILISNFKYGDEQKLQITDAHLRAINPRLICGKITGFGSESDRVAYDLILQAETGFMAMNGTPDSGPVKLPIAFIDVLAAHQLKEGLLLALYHRQLTGEARSVAVSLYDAAVTSLANQASNYLMQRELPQRIGSLHPNIAPYGELFTTRDNRLITFAIGSNAHFQKLCVFLSLQKLPHDARFSENTSRVEHRHALQELLQKAIHHYTAEEVLTAMHAVHVPVGEIKNLEEVFQEDAARQLIRKELIDGIPTQRVSSIGFKWI